MDFTVINRLGNESEESYLWRIGQMKDSGVLDITWTDIANLINHEFRPDESEYRTEAAYRKKYIYAKSFYDAGIFNSSEMDDELNKLNTIKESIIKEKRKLYDQRREYNKILTHEARSEHLTEELIKAANNLNSSIPLIGNEKIMIPNLKKEAVLFLADWHYSMVTDNVWNKYNTKICIERIVRLIVYVEEFLKINKIDLLHIVLLGDFAHGACHTSCRIKSEEDTCDQIMNVSELLARTINELSKSVNSVQVYSCYGNHLRTIQNKSESVDSDNLEKLIPWWLKQRLSNNSKVQIIDSEYKEFVLLQILGCNIVCVHGNKENFKDFAITANTIFTQKFNKKIDYTVSADKHHLEEFEQFGIESILVRSLCGTDDFANDKRLYSHPGQTLIIFNNDYGREATYNITLD